MLYDTAPARLLQWAAAFPIRCQVVLGCHLRGYGMIQPFALDVSAAIWRACRHSRMALDPFG